MQKNVFISILFCLSLQSCFALDLYTSPDQLPNNEYDFVIAGGGTAGCVLATRLTEAQNVSVLIVEAGGNNKDFFDSIVPFLTPFLANTEADWNYTTTPQVGYNNRVIPFERGHMLGGSSSVNYLGYNRGSNDVWDRFANITGDNGWSWSAVNKYYRKSSRLVPPADGRNYSSDTIASAHGYGPIEVGIAGYPYHSDYLVINASENLEGRFVFNQDLNAGNTTGFGWSQSTIGNSRRSDSATAYLNPLYNNNAQLDVLINTQVIKLVQTAKESSNTNETDYIPEFKGAQLAQPNTNNTASVYARREVILSTGVIGTPKLLMLSGIGSSTTLTSLSITPIVDLPDVGHNLTDHPLNPVYWTVQQNTTVDPILQNQTVFAERLLQWNQTGQGPMVDSYGNVMAFQRLPTNASIWQNVTVDPAAGPLSGNTELLFAEGFIPLSNIPLPKSGNYFTTIGIVVSPTSRGSVSLNSSDPFADPVINPAYLTTPFDQYTMVQSMRDIFTVIRDPVFDGYIGQPYGPLANVTSYGDMLAYARAYSATINHAVGTAKMSARGAEWGVLEPDLTVKGVKGLRVVDASIMPEIPECHMQGPVYIIAERAADLIKEAYDM